MWGLAVFKFAFAFSFFSTERVPSTVRKEQAVKWGIAWGEVGWRPLPFFSAEGSDYS